MSKDNNVETNSFFKRLKRKILRKRNLCWLLNVIINIILMFFVLMMDILPVKYNILFFVVIFIINIITFILINVHKKLVLKIIGWVIIMPSICGSVIGIYYLNSTNKFIKKSFDSNEVYDKNTYYVLTKKDSKLTKNDIKGDISTYRETVNLDKAIDKLDKKYSIKNNEFEDVGDVYNSVSNGDADFMLIDKASYEIVFSIDTELNKDDYEIIYEYDVFTKRDAKNSKNTSKFNIYVGGTDFAGLMDFNMIISVNMETHKVILTSIPRDYYIEVVGKDGRYDKLSFMNIYGADVNRESLEKLFDTNIDYSIKVNTSSLVNVVDYLGGIEFCSDYSYTTSHALVNNTYNDRGRKLKVNKGCQHINGIEALTIARERNAFPGRDRVRQENCQKIILEILKKLISTDTIIHYNETLNTLSSLYETDIPREVITETFKDILNNGNHWEVETQAVDGKDSHDKVHLSNMTDWVMYPDMETVTNASSHIKENIK